MSLDHWSYDMAVVVSLISSEGAHCLVWGKQLEIDECILSTLATDALLLNHGAISIHTIEQISIVLDQFQTKILHLFWQH